jgi:hypothetical protein
MWKQVFAMITVLALGAPAYAQTAAEKAAQTAASNAQAVVAKVAAEKAAADAKAKEAEKQAAEKAAALKKAEEEAAKAIAEAKAAAEAKALAANAAKAKELAEAKAKADKIAAEKAAADKAALEAKIKTDKAAAEKVAAEQKAREIERKAKAELVFKGTIAVVQQAPQPAKAVDPEVAKAAECHAIKAEITAKQNRYAEYQRQINAHCQGDAMAKFMADQKKADTDYSVAVASVNAKMAAVQAKLKAGAGDPCNENMSLDECVVAVSKLEESNKALSVELDSLKHSSAELARVKNERSKLSGNDLHKKLDECRILDLNAQRNVREIRALIQANEAKLNTCMGAFGAACMARLAARRHEASVYQSMREAALQTKRCLGIKAKLRGFENANRAERRALRSMGCMTSRQVNQWAAANEKNLQNMPGAKVGATVPQLETFIAAVQNFKKALVDRQGQQGKCDAAIQKRIDARSILEKFVVETRSELRACSIAIKSRRGRFAVAASHAERPAITAVPK